MGRAESSLACAGALLDALAAGGVRHVCLSPGSRSTPLALAAARDPRLEVHLVLDERASGFQALGIAKATGVPAATICTSGTAAAAFLPAVVEASQSRTPMLVLTADRPPRLRGTGANQTVDQVELYGRYARAWLEPPVPATGDPAELDRWAEAGRAAVVAALGRGDAPAGPVQVNCPFDEPLVPAAPGTGDASAPTETEPVEVDAPEADLDAVGRDAVATLRDLGGRRGVILIGGLRHPSTLSVLSLGAILGWPVLAEPLSGLRIRGSADVGTALSAGTWLLGDPWLERHRPEVILQVGAAPTSRAAQALAGTAAQLVVLDRDHLDPDPEGRATLRLHHDAELFGALAWDRFRGPNATHEPPTPPATWLDAWRTADLVARRMLDRTLEADDRTSELRTARDLASFVPNGAALVVGSSTPVRDLDAAMAPRRPPLVWHEGDLVRFVANRGASGIDGSIATAAGVALAGVGPTYALLGDLAFLYDLGALAWLGRGSTPGPRANLVITVVRNGGGRIFSLLGQRDLPAAERALFETPHTADLAALCSAAGITHRGVIEGPALAPALERSAKEGGITVVEVTVDPDHDRDVRTRVRGAVRAGLERVDPS
jgi:2-succinyl-5-enolpyruvyl-6-hydroxy-3-cyclohexene-1-carboxylate synthase